MNIRSDSYAAPFLIFGCVLFGLGSLIVRFVPVGPYAVAFWRLLIAAGVFWLLCRFSGKSCLKAEGRSNMPCCPAYFWRLICHCGMKAYMRLDPGFPHCSTACRYFFCPPSDFSFSRTLEQPASFEPDIGSWRDCPNRQSRVQPQCPRLMGLCQRNRVGRAFGIVYGVRPQNA